MNSSPTVAIIGAGIVGCATAYYLAKRGISCHVYDKGPVNGEQSSRAWGFVRQQGRDPAELPLMIEANRLWQSLERELGADLGWRQEGVIYLAYDDRRMAEFAAWIEAARPYQLQTRLLSAAEVKEKLPGFQGACCGALYTPNDGHADPERGAPAFRRAAEALGAVFHTPCAVTAIQQRGGRVAGLVTEHGEVEAGTVVCAAGAWTSRLLRPLGVSLPVLWTRSSVARTTPVHPITPLGVWAKVAFRQRRDGSLNIALGGRTDCDITTDSLRWGRYFAPLYWQKRRAVTVRLGKPLWDDLRGHYTPGKSLTLDPAAHPARVAAALATLKASFPHRADLQDAAITTTWAGYIDCTPDMVPVIDAPSTPGNLLIATGMSGHGFGLGPGVGKAVAEWIDRGTTTFDLTPFRLGRFAEPGPHRPRAVI